MSKEKKSIPVGAGRDEEKNTAERFKGHLKRARLDKRD